MKSTTLFGLYAASIVVLAIAIGGVTLYSLDKARWWDARIQLAQTSYSHHLNLESNLFNLIKQHSFGLLIGDRDEGTGERELKQRINQNIADIRNTIAREIEMVGEEEVEELELLDQIATDIIKVNNELSKLAADDGTLASPTNIERLTVLLDTGIEQSLAAKIEAALEEEKEEVEETLADADAFRTWNERFIYSLLLVALLLVGIGLVSFNRLIRRPMLVLKHNLARLRRADYNQPVGLGGCAEFQDLGEVLSDMAQALSEREATREEQQQYLETTVEKRTSELQKLVDQLETGEENRKRLMADISHELRTPLTIILGEAEVALRNSRDLSGPVSDALARIRDASKHTNQIVDDMLTVARHEAGQLRLDKRDIDVRHVVQEAIEMFPQDILYEVPDNEIMLSIDRVRVRQSILALFQNARRYGGPTISVDISQTSDTLEIVVEDDGPGLDRDEKRNAFERFFRGSNASGKGIEGNGLGLPLVKSIIESHGGSVSLSDADLGGLAVHIFLPLKPTMRLVKSDLPVRRVLSI